MLQAYREESFAKSPEVLAEMKEVCRLLHKWRKYKPIVAGGSLWAWAANRLCRDADIFMNKRMFLEKKLLREYTPSRYFSVLAERYTVSDYFGSSTHEHRIECSKLSYVLPVTKTAVDLVIVKGLNSDYATDGFDYLHCRVGFGKDILITDGVDAYSEGNLQRMYNAINVRSEELIESKLQDSLWGKDTAKVKLLDTMGILQKMYKEVEKES